MLGQDWVPGIVHVVSSTERNAIDGAAIVAAHLNLALVTHPGLGENDRSATGYLPKPEFETVADAFFGCPEEACVVGNARSTLRRGSSRRCAMC